MKTGLAKHFKIKDLDEVNFLLSIEVTCDGKAGTIELSQQAYIEQLLKHFNLQDVNPMTTPLSSGVRLTQDNCLNTNEGREDMGNVPYANLVRALMYATIGTRPDIAFAVGALSCFLSNPRRHHWNEAKCTLCYLKGTANHAIHYSSSVSPTGRIMGYSHSVGMKLTELIKGFCNLDWAGCVDARRSTSGFVWMMSGSAVCWRSKLQSIVVLLSMEAEYVGATPAVQEIIWLRDLLCELNIINDSPSVLNMDNQGAVYLTHGAGNSNKTKHIDIRYHFIHTHIEEKHIQVQYLLMAKVTANILTKNLRCTKHDYFVQKLGIVARSNGY